MLNDAIDLINKFNATLDAIDIAMDIFLIAFVVLIILVIICLIKISSIKHQLEKYEYARNVNLPYKQNYNNNFQKSEGVGDEQSF